MTAGVLAERSMSEEGVGPGWMVAEPAKWIVMSPELGGKKEVRAGDVLAEVKRMRRDLEQYGEISQETWNYVEANERTNALEATTDGHLFLTHQNWNGEWGEFTAFGESMLDMWQGGIDAIEVVTQSDGFEWQRRKLELEEEKALIEMMMSGSWRENVKVTISPFPDEMDPDEARGYGYNPENKRAMIRIHDIGVDGTKRIIQLAVDSSDLGVFADLVGWLGVEVDGEVSTSVDLMGYNNSLVINRETLPLGVVSVAQKYDELMERKYGGVFFLGKPVNKKEEGEYGLLENKREFVEEQAGDLISHLVEFDYKLAMCLNEGRVTDDGLRERLKYLLNVTDESGRFVLSQRERWVLEGVQDGGSFVEDAARILKEKELIKVWTLMTAMVDEKRAIEVFGENKTEKMRNIVENGLINQDESSRLIDDVVVSSPVAFYTCMGALGGVNLYALSPGTAMKLMNGGEVSDYVWVCESCGHVNEIDVPNGKLKDCCDGCGMSGRC